MTGERGCGKRVRTAVTTAHVISGLWFKEFQRVRPETQKSRDRQTKTELKHSDQSELLLRFFGESNDNTTQHITCQGQHVWLSRVGRYARRHLVRAPVELSLCLFPTLHGRECQCFHAHWLRLHNCALPLIRCNRTPADAFRSCTVDSWDHTTKLTCLDVYIYICLYIYICICIHIYICMYTSICSKYTYVSFDTHVVYISINVYIHVHINICICMYICIYVYIYIYET